MERESISRYFLMISKEYLDVLSQEQVRGTSKVEGIQGIRGEA
jgi:hypothetical protein